MRALVRCRKELDGYTVAICQAQNAVKTCAARLVQTYGLNIEVLPRVEYSTILKHMASSRIFMALTVNDGLPSMLCEAMGLGAFPVHSRIESVEEWVTDGDNGLLVPAEDPQATAQALRRALLDDALVGQAMIFFPGRRLEPPRAMMTPNTRWP